MRYIDYKNADKALQEQVWGLYEGSFPACEKRSYPAFITATSDARFNAKVILNDGGNLAAILFYWLADNMLYVEHLAVNPVMRGENIGSTVLKELIKTYKNHVIILEIDPPVDEISIRRLNFYERVGFVSNDYHFIHPSFAVGEKAQPHKLVILTYGKTISPEEFGAFKELLKNVALKYID